LGLAAALTCLMVLGSTAVGQTEPSPIPSPPILPALPPLEQAKPSIPPATKPQPKASPAAAPRIAPNALPAIDSGDPLGKNSDGGNELPVDAGPGQTNENPTGRQEPGVSLEWIGPPTTKIGQPATYQIIVKNISSCAVQHVVIRNRVPNGITVQGTEPKAFNESNLWLWDLGTLAPRQEKRLDMVLLAEVKGDLSCQASVTFTGATTARIRVREPKLALKASAPEKVLLGDVATVAFTVSNPGDAGADHVRLKAMLSDGLQHAQGRIVEFDLGNLGPNENRSIQVVCGTKSGGEQHCEGIATAEGDLSAHDSALIDVLLPKLEVAVNGPHLRYLDRHATYTFKVTNPGSAPANNVTVNDVVPAGFKFVKASDGGRHDFSTRCVSWYIGDLTPGQSREVSMEVTAVNTGVHKHAVSAVASRGLKTETEAVTRVEGLSALLMELVDLDDPVEIGADTAYEIRVTNTGSKTETNLQLSCTIPDKMEFRGAVGAAACHFRLQGKELIFEPLPKLAPRADAIYRVNVRGIAAGDLRFRARITADGLTDPVLKEESTKVYGDEAPMPGSPKP